MKNINREQAKKDISNTMYQFTSIENTKEMLNKYKWFSLASGVKDENLTLELMKEIIKEGTYHYKIQ